jgi:hypothetical protein
MPSRLPPNAIPPEKTAGILVSANARRSAPLHESRPAAFARPHAPRRANPCAHSNLPKTGMWAPIREAPSVHGRLIVVCRRAHVGNGSNREIRHLPLDVRVALGSRPGESASVQFEARVVAHLRALIFEERWRSARSASTFASGVWSPPTVPRPGEPSARRGLVVFTGVGGNA